MAWICLLAAGCLEMVWVTAMKLSDGFTRVGYSVLTVAAMAASVWLLAQAVKTLPMGTAYAVWTGIGALGAVVPGIRSRRIRTFHLSLIRVKVVSTGQAGHAADRAGLCIPDPPCFHGIFLESTEKYYTYNRKDSCFLIIKEARGECKRPARD